MVEELPSLPRLHLVQGVRNPAVAEVRDRLERLGLLGVCGSEVDHAFFSPELDVAVRQFQQDRGIMIDGIVGPATFRQLEEARWNLGDRIVSYSFGHMTAGDDIANLQRQLNTLGFDAGRVDGVFGPDTDQALREFQRNVGLEVDGTCGPEVWRALDRLSRTVKGGAAAALRSEHHHAMARTGVADKVVVIDPGHGGDDYGDVAHRLAESIVADDLCRRIEGRLAAIGTQVLVTRPRTHDMTEPIDETTRAQFANNTGADLVVSLHTDSEPTGVARGIATYYFGNPHDESMMGRRFAELVQHEIVRRTDLVDCRTHGKTWDLLRLTRMPAVRIEFGYLSNPSDAERLADADFRDVVSEAVAIAVVRFFAPGGEN
ncbi:MAG: N-acetylmuramoyl-L-alanine amidase [Candidatus Nanopelagicales bacterium]